MVGRWKFILGGPILRGYVMLVSDMASVLPLAEQVIGSTGANWRYMRDGRNPFHFRLTLSPQGFIRNKTQQMGNEKTQSQLNPPPLTILELVGGWTNPSEKYSRQNGNLPQFSGWSLSCHHQSQSVKSFTALEFPRGKVWTFFSSFCPAYCFPKYSFSPSEAAFWDDIWWNMNVSLRNTNHS